ncbi:MAG: thioester reductase domain-containing protein, partial [Planctomycetota bacterium]
GAFVLAALLETDVPRVHCLVRGTDDAASRQRLAEKLEAFGLGEVADDPRIEVLAGDVAAERFGWSPAWYEAMAERIGRVIHVAASTSFFRPYRALRGPNVEGTQEALRFACHGRAKAFDHVSTVGVFETLSPFTTPLDEDSPLPPLAELAGDYARSKSAAERLVGEAAKRGLRVRIHRPGRLAADRRRGAVNPEDIAVRLVRLCLDLGALPDIDADIDVTPVDLVAEAIVRLGRAPGATGKAHHLFGASILTLDEMRAWTRSTLPEIRTIPQAEWMACAAELLLHEQPALAAVLEPLLREAPQEASSLDVSSTRTWQLLAELGLKRSQPNREWWSRVLERLTEESAH